MKRNVVQLMPADAIRSANRDLRVFERGDQVELCRALVEELRVCGKIVFDDGALYRYSDELHIFVTVSEAEQSRIVQDFAGLPAGEKGRPLRLSRSDVIGATRLAWDLVSDVGFFADAPPGIVFSGGFVEVTAGGCIEKPHSVEHRARFVYPFAFVPDAFPPSSPAIGSQARTTRHTVFGGGFWWRSSTGSSLWDLAPTSLRSEGHDSRAPDPEAGGVTMTYLEANQALGTAEGALMTAKIDARKAREPYTTETTA